MSGKAVIPMLDLPRLHAPLELELTAAFQAALGSGRFIGGPAVAAFEEALARRCEVPHAVGVSSGTDALLAALMALGVRPGDQIITTPYTFFATAGAVARLGARPVFVDIDPVTYSIDPAGLEEAVTARTVGILPVHLFGCLAPMDAISRVARGRNLWVLEDAAQSIGAQRDGRSPGTLGDAATLSFFPAKNLGALGDGGAVLTRGAELAGKIQALREHGASRKYRHEFIGGNFRLDALQAALLSVKLPRLEGWEEGRRRVARRYAELLGDAEDIVLPHEPPGAAHVFNQYVVRVPRRDAVLERLRAERIGCAVYYPIPLHLQPCFAELGHRRGDFPESERAAAETLALPVDPLLEEEQLERIAATLKKAVQ